MFGKKRVTADYLNQNKLNYHLNKTLFIVEFLLKNKKMILKDNVYFLIFRKVILG
jgi:hypothetical protein